MDDRSSGRSSWFIPVLVAIITAAGAIAVAIINLPDDDNGPVTSVTSPQAAPDIGGAYHLDPGNPRIIWLDSQGGDAYAIYEQEPADWPFNGVVKWMGGNEFEGIADFDAGARMNVVIEQMPDDRLLTEFRFIVDQYGVSTDRVDKHVLVPVG